MNVRPESLHLSRQWIGKAEGDLQSAEHLLSKGAQWAFPTTCFHAQQCAEKYLKAILTLHSVPFPKTHDLTDLVHLVPSNIKLRIELVDLGTLNRYAVEARYPGDWEPIEREDAEQAVAIARKVRDAVRDNLPGEATEG